MKLWDFLFRYPYVEKIDKKWVKILKNIIKNPKSFFNASLIPENDSNVIKQLVGCKNELPRRPEQPNLNRNCSKSSFQLELFQLTV